MIQESNYMGYDGFVWWMGVVEDRMDPLKLGRCRVRIAGAHTPDKTLIPTDDLPWAHPMLPLTDSSMLMAKEGDYVVGFYLDGPNAQNPVIMGILPGIPDRLLDKSKGFSDPRTDAQLKSSPRPPKELKSTAGVGVKITEFAKAQRYPNAINEPTTSRLARNEKIGETIVKSKKDSLVKNAKTTWYQSFNEPPTPYNAKYPYNKVFETESGHLLEYDDTPGAERIHLYHRSGSFIEMHNNGTVVVKTAADDYQFVLADKKIYVSGDCHISSDQNIYMKAVGDIVMEATNIIMNASDSIGTSAFNSISATCGNEFSVVAGISVDLSSLLSFNILGLASMEFATGGFATIESNFTSLSSTGLIDVSAGGGFSVAASGPIELGSASSFEASGGAVATLFSGGVTTVQGTTTLINPGTSVSPPQFTPPGAIVPPILPVFLMPSMAAIATLRSKSEQKLIAIEGSEAPIDGGGNPANAESLKAPVGTPSVSALPDSSETDGIAPPPQPPVKTSCAGVTVPPIDYEFQLSPRFKLKHLTTSALFVHYIPDDGWSGLTAGEIICNLKALAETILEPLCNRYPGFRINSGFRQQNEKSQHARGEAVDLQWPGYSTDQMYRIAQWMKQNLNFDQLIFEYGNSTWIHVSFVRQEYGGNRPSTQTNKVCSYNPNQWPNPIGSSGYYAQGLILLADRAQTAAAGGGTVFT